MINVVRHSVCHLERQVWSRRDVEFSLWIPDGPYARQRSELAARICALLYATER